MLSSFVFALLLTAGVQSQAADRSRAEDLARAGQTAEAMALFTRIVEADPADVDAKLWVARLNLRLGRTSDAEEGFRAVLRDHPSDVDARIGLGMALTRQGAWQDALAILRQTEADAGENADLFGALARAYRRAGDDPSALDYFRRARALSPSDPDMAMGFEGVARTYGHWLAVEGFGQTGGAGTGVASWSVAGSLRVMPSLHLDGTVRAQDGPDYSDMVGGGGVLWRAARNLTVAFHALGGSGNAALPRSDLSGDLVHYAGVFEIGASLRRMSFADADIVAASPVFAWNPDDRWRLDSRYTYSRSTFQSTGQSSGDNSVMLRETWQGWRRVALQGLYAYGIESFEDLTADRIGALGSTTLAAGMRFDVPSLTRITTTWEHQWRSNDTKIDRITISVVQAIP